MFNRFRKKLPIEYNFRDLVVGVNQEIPLINGRYSNSINFDNAATTPPLKSVLYRINHFCQWYSSIHRGTGYKSRYSSRLYEEGRENIADFVNADLSKDSIIFVKNTTEGINKLSYRLIDKGDRDVVLSTCMEHHSNDLPWRGKFHLDYIEVDEKGRLSIDDLKKKLNKYSNRIKLVAVSGASNVTGYMNPIHKIAKLVHSVGGKILVDAAQLAPHYPIDMKPHNSNQHIDYLVFSAHKMYAPFGIGVLIGPKETFTGTSPEYTGGGTIDIVTHDFVKWAEPPHSDEAGSPNVIGVIALSEAIKSLVSMNMNNIHEQEKKLTAYTIEALKNIPYIKLYGDIENYSDRLGIITFNMEDLDHSILANILSYEGGIAVRNGCFCAHPYLYRLMEIDNETIKKYVNNPKLPKPGMVRVSFGIYNTFDEVDILIKLLRKVSQNRSYYLNKYKAVSIDI